MYLVECYVFKKKFQTTSFSILQCIYPLLCTFFFLANTSFSLEHGSEIAFTSSIYDRSVFREPFENDLNISQEEKDSTTPYLLPEDHPLTPILDSIFLSSRPLYNSKTFKAAGFVSKFIQPRSFIRVASHDLMPGYLFKVYLDSELRQKRKIPGWKWFANRAKNARVIEDFIRSNGIKHFVVPKKWIYPTPLSDRSQIPGKGKYSIKNEILVVEDMQLVSKKENKKAWKSVITKEHLDEFLAIIRHAGGASYRADNVAFTKHGTFAFIDTEYTNQHSKARSILPYLSPKMREYWIQITNENMNNK